MTGLADVDGFLTFYSSVCVAMLPTPEHGALKIMSGKFQISTRSISPLEHIKRTIQPDRFWFELNVVICFNNLTTDPHNIHVFSVQPINSKGSITPVIYSTIAVAVY